MVRDTLRKLKTDMLSKARQRAREQGLPFNIDIDDIEIPELCPVLSIPLKKGTKTSHNNSPTLDRIVSSLGYVKGNIVVVSHRANRLKSNATIDELQLMTKYYSKYIKERFLKP